jgi:hypothetical protein
MAERLIPGGVFVVETNANQAQVPGGPFLNGAGATLYYVIGPSAGWTNPTAANVIAGQLAGGGAATAKGYEPAPLVTTSPFTFANTATGLTAGTVYKVALVWSDGIGVSNVEVSADFTTTSGDVQFRRPVSTLVQGAWLPSTPAAPLYTMVDEAIADDADYMYVGQSGSATELALQSVADAGVGFGKAVRVRAMGFNGETLRVKLMQGATQIASWDQVLTGSYVLYEFNLTSLEIAAITDYTALSLKYEGV